MSAQTAQHTPAAVLERTDDPRLRERLLGMAAQKSPVVRNGRFFFSKDLNALTYWYEDHKDSTRMVYIAAEG